MHSSPSRIFAYCLFTVLFFCLATPTCANADVTIIPWMTGTFWSFSDYTFGVGGTSPDGQWFFGISAYPNYQIPPLTWECDEFVCYGQGWGSIDDGPVFGEITRLNVYEAGYMGVITGGSIYKQEWIYGEEDHRWTQFSFDFTGAWTNGWHTFGNVYASWSSDSEPYCEFYMTTYATPEPATIVLLGSGLAGLVVRLKRRS